ncbi:hypothetical protein AVEN_33292-1 [Araneus ventricosus]|uniref:Uncharacterized protein n=1 Tax=Araneus ventricosus TaxID=182803 RepID=A0A4Y2T3H9_ARAVE|nr:hypothetical protein AVEN_33292-1 [Araneus ventricosus]
MNRLNSARPERDNRHLWTFRFPLLSHILEPAIHLPCQLFQDRFFPAHFNRKIQARHPFDDSKCAGDREGKDRSPYCCYSIPLFLPHSSDFRFSSLVARFQSRQLL